MFVLDTALKDLKRRLRDPAAFALWVGMPLALVTMISLAFGGFGGAETPTAEIWVVDDDESTLSGILVTALSAGGDFGFPLIAREVESAEGRTLIDDGKGSALLIIPPDFGDDLLNERPTTLELVTNPTQYVLPQIVEESLRLLVDAVFYLQQTVGEPISRIVEAADTSDGFLDNSEVAEISVLINEAMMRMDSLLFPPVIDLEIVAAGQAGDSDDAAAGPGFIEIFLPAMLFMALVFMALGISEDLWIEKRQGTLRRALATPNASAKFLAGKLLSATVLMGVIAFVSLIVARYLLGAQVQNLVQAGLWTTFAGAFFLVLVFPLQLYASSQRAGGVLSGLIMMPLLMLGGSFFPFEIMPEGFSRIGRFTPNGWALMQLNDILRADVDWGRLGLTAAGIAVIGCAVFLVANRRMAGAFARS
jgi:ABC-type multidrug transport system permease subunit